ncbi:hypothetical protein CC1G_06858 [Coprinopsis cinerea okayama7|uniref:Uncharacterized protein n=1 Tax=Coprinopsis cinerea (strain Okayama-7 / 130 / ATCC MYA-4618 / FGSC 9003) TaxID=240176 RepID=A8N6Y6_COPC7|nr:hypothetical protein CC1G_06858 [Coprinopsis cinerea okayama7\|eukprot:XP_001830592.2 hypothetical protein CC1G_06858 [Coprinopsis cinerea okayama7\
MGRSVRVLTLATKGGLKTENSSTNELLVYTTPSGLDFRATFQLRVTRASSGNGIAYSVIQSMTLGENNWDMWAFEETGFNETLEPTSHEILHPLLVVHIELGPTRDIAIRPSRARDATFTVLLGSLARRACLICVAVALRGDVHEKHEKAIGTVALQGVDGLRPTRARDDAALREAPVGMERGYLGVKIFKREMTTVNLNIWAEIIPAQRPAFPKRRSSTEE